MNLAPSIYCGLKRLATILGARFMSYLLGKGKGVGAT